MTGNEEPGSEADLCVTDACTKAGQYPIFNSNTKYSHRLINTCEDSRNLPQPRPTWPICFLTVDKSQAGCAYVYTPYTLPLLKP